MTKFILLMFICSNIAGNECKLIPTPISEFDTLPRVRLLWL